MRSERIFLAWLQVLTYSEPAFQTMVPLTILVQDSCPPTLPPTLRAEVELWRDNAGSICAYGWVQGDTAWMVLPNVARFRITMGNQHVTALTAPGVPNALVEDAYYRSVLPLALQLGGQDALHASAVCTAYGIVAFCAVSETGKSTLAYALSRRGHHLWADDAVVFDVFSCPARAIPLPFSLQLRAASAAYFGLPDQARSFATGNGSQENSVPLAAIGVLQRLPDAPGQPMVCVKQLAPAAAFAALLPHAYCFSLRDEQRKKVLVQHYCELARQVPVLQIQFQPDLSQLPSLLDAIEHALDGLHLSNNMEC